MADIVVYKCQVCGKAWTNQRSLAAHMKVHKDVEFRRITVRLTKERAEAFKDLVRRHNTTECHLILSMIDLYLEGEKWGLVSIPSTNPIVVQMISFFGAKPRGHGKYDVGAVSDTLLGLGVKNCHICGSSGMRLVRSSYSGLIEGRCLACGAEWLIHKKS